MLHLFATYPTASRDFDFVHDLGIAEESRSFEFPDSQNPFKYIVVVVMQAKAERIITLQNRVVIIGKPALTGLQVILVPTLELELHNASLR